MSLRWAARTPLKTIRNIRTSSVDAKLLNPDHAFHSLPIITLTFTTEMVPRGIVTVTQSGPYPRRCGICEHDLVHLDLSGKVSWGLHRAVGWAIPGVGLRLRHVRAIVVAGI